MGEVYRASDTRLDRAVAIKVLPSHLSEHPELKQRFEREAKTISSLQHPNICALFDVGHEDGIDFLVMEYLEGQTLAERLAEGPIPSEELLSIGVQITGALDNAHRNGVTHRDLKPGNIMLTKAGVKLLDFGLAKTAEGGGATTDSSLTKLTTAQHGSDPLTEQGTVLGTFQYMSPEQLEGEEADARSDIFALGAVLYEMATGKRAFEGKSQASLIAAIMQSQPQPITAIQPMTPPALDRVIRTCLEKDRDNRWQTAHDVGLQLKWIAEGGSQVGVPKPVASRRRSRERTAWIVAGVSVIAALLLAALWVLAPEPEPPMAMRFAIEAPPGVVSFGSPRISPDGRTIVFNGVDTTGTTMIWLRPLNSLDAHPLPGTEGAGRPFWSADSRHVAYFDGPKLKRIPITGGPAATICEFSRGADGVWGAQNMILFDGTTGDSVQVVPAGGGEPGPATRIDRSRGETMHGWPFFLPDGKRFGYIAFRAGEPSEIRLGELGTFESKRLTEGDSRVEYVAPGYLIFERGGALLAQPFDADAGELDGDPFPLAEGIGTGDVGLAHFSGSRTGTLIFTSGDRPERQFGWFDREGREMGVFGTPKRYRQPALSPDESKVVVEVEDENDGSTDLWTIDLRRGVESRFTFDAGSEQSPVWTNDGKYVYYTTNAEGTFEVVRKNAYGTGSPEAIHKAESNFVPTGFTPDGKSLLAFARSPKQGFNVVAIPAEGGDVVEHVFTQAFEVHGRVSPNGDYLAYVSFESGRWEVYVTTYPGGGGRWQVSVNGGTEPFWRGDGKEMFFVSLDRKLMAVDVDMGPPIEFGIPHKLFDAPMPRNFNTRNRYFPTDDGQRFLMLTLLDRGRVPPTTVILNWAAELAER
jgi:Tol biopolymer transport system component